MEIIAIIILIYIWQSISSNSNQNEPKRNKHNHIQTDFEDESLASKKDTKLESIDSSVSKQTSFSKLSTTNNSTVFQILTNHNIKKLYHFTNKANIASIIESGGLYSQKNLHKMQKRPIYATNELSWELDSLKGLDKYVSLSFVTNLPMYWKNKYEKGNRFVWLQIDLEVLAWPGTLLSNINATDSYAIIDKVEKVLPLLDLDLLAKDRKLSTLTQEEKKKMQAEVLVPNFIPITKILNIDTFI
ncbi:hypothetical protein NNO_0797 [Hydrogenimonas sp.]|nr:hypothetical protein NNO_0797 [Hydrogenimonas sp.]